MKHLIEPLDFTTEEYEEIFRLVDNIIANPGDYSHVCDNKLLASLFLSLPLGRDYPLRLQC